MIRRGVSGIVFQLLLLVIVRASAAYAQTGEAWTWVVYSSSSLEKATEVQEEYAGLNLVSSVVEGRIGQTPTYRVAVGRFDTRRAARRARSLLPAMAPADTWLLRLADTANVGGEDEPRERIRVIRQPAVTPPKEPAVAARAPGPAPVAGVGVQAKIPGPDVISGDTVDTPHEEPAPRLGGLWHAQVRVSNTYSSNIDHDADDVQSFGLVPSLQLRFQDHPTDAVLTIDYTAARHAYTNTERWDRVSHAGRVELAPELDGLVRLSTTAEASLRGSSEDRDLSDQYRITQEVEFRLTPNNRLQTYGAARWKRSSEDDRLDSFKPHVGLRLDNRLSGERRWEFGARYERNEATTPDRDYARWTFDTEYRFPALGTRSEIRLGFTYRKKDYDRRLVEVDDGDVLRSDRRYIADIAWTHWFGPAVGIELGYEFESRDSTDPDKIFDAHEVGFSLVFDL